MKAIYPGTEAVLWAHGFLTYAKRTWNGKTQDSQPVQGNPVRQDPAALCLAKAVTLAPRSIQAVYVRCSTNGRCLLYERPHKLAKKGIRLHNALANVRTRRDARLYLTNLTDQPVNLPKNFAVGLAMPHDGPVYEVPEDRLPGTCEGAAPVNTLGGTQGNTPSEAPSAKSGPSMGHAGDASRSGESRPKMDGVGSNPMPKVAWNVIPQALHTAVRDLLERYKGLWDGHLGRMDITPHRITLKEGAKPVRSQPYRTGLHHRDLIKDQVAKQSKLGVIEPSQAEWSFPVVLVPKPDGSPRFCVDYRRLNDLTVKDAYPLPRMDDCIDFLDEATVLSMLDANAGYWQIPVAPEDRDKTTFTCHEGTYRYIRLPFGLTNAPATFQRAIDMILSGVKWKTCLVYLDNIIVFSTSPEEHLAHLNEIFGLLARAGVSLKASTCFLFHEEVEYLGHIVSRGHLRVNEKNLVGLRKARTPRIKKDLRSFLGMCNVYRRFVKDYAKVARPLLALTSSKIPDPLPPFTGEQMEAFKDLKDRLTHTPILALPRPTGHYIVDTDASATQVGCVLLQEQEDRAYKPVRYWSRVLTSSERNYSTKERECLAVIWALFLLRPYLQGTRLVVRTDRTALKWMLHMDGAHGRLARWRVRLAEFNYTVESRPGQHHRAADVMSRLATTVQGRRRTNYLKLFPATEPFTEVCLDLLGPLPETSNGNVYLLVIVDRFTKLTRVVPFAREDADTVVSAFLDTWVASYGPPDTLLTDNGPQLASTHFRGGCGMLGIKHVTSTTDHPQTQGQVERYDRTIVTQLRTYVEDHQDRWDELASVLTVAYNSRPHQSTGVAPFEFVAPDRVRTFALDRLPESPYPKQFTGDPRQAREARRAHLRNLAFKVRKNLDLAQRRYKKGYDNRVQPAHQALRVGDWIYVDTHDKDRKKLDQRVKGPYRILSRDDRTFTILDGVTLDRVSSDHVARAPTPAGETDSTSTLRGLQEPVVPSDHEDIGVSFVWERFVGHDRDQDGELWVLVRWWGYDASEDTWEPAHKFDRAKVIQYCQRVGTEPPMLEEVSIALLEQYNAMYNEWPWCLEPGADLCPCGSERNGQHWRWT